MLLIERIREFPLLARIGLVGMVLGAVLDIAMSLTAGTHVMHQGMQMGVNHTGHLIALAGMVLVLAGVVFDGARRQRNRRSSAAKDSGGLDSNAHR
jgi:predicted phage tail protein